MGTNSFHLLVARADNKGYLQTLDTHKESVRLGEGIGSDGKISDSKIEEAVSALRRMKDIANQYSPIFRVLATQATRAAENYQDFLEMIEKATDLKVEIIDGLEEARLTYLGMNYCHESTEDITLGLDIGGGSTEVVVGQGSKILFMTSLKMGALTATKRFFDMSTPSASQIADLKDYILTRLAPIQENVKFFKIRRAFATSGTAKAIGRLHHLETRGCGLEQANGYKFPADEIPPIADKLCQLAAPEHIKNHYEIDLRRSEIITAGTLIFTKVSDVFSVPEWTVSTFGIREGIVLDTYGRLQMQLGEEQLNQQWKSLESFAQRLKLDINFANVMKDSTLDLFDQAVTIFPKSRLPINIESYRSLLAAAAFLNESGKFINFTSHHKHSYYLISQANLLGFSREEKHVVALINRFARKRTASHQKINDYPYLKGKVEIINFLGSCVRTAKALNRSRSQCITDNKLEWTLGKIILNVKFQKKSSIDAEIKSLQSEAKAISKGWGCEIELRLQES